MSYTALRNLDYGCYIGYLGKTSPVSKILEDFSSDRFFHDDDDDDEVKAKAKALLQSDLAYG